MPWMQKEFSLSPRRQGFHLVTEEILLQLPELSSIRTGLLHLFLQHTSASLTINENADPTVRSDLDAHFRRLVPESGTYTHDTEGPDDMPAHLKAAILGSGLTVPITNGRLNLGTWQGIYLCEHRARGGSRHLVATIWGEVERQAATPGMPVD
jgi:secondary thiamine-phosphate synthase enzyme